MSHGLSIRGDSLYCPLCFSLDSYGDCLNDCWHCYLRRLNHIWNNGLNPIDPNELESKLVNGLKNSSPKTSLAHAIKKKKVLRFGNKTDPFQKSEREYRISQQCIKILKKLEWPFVIQTMVTEIMMDYFDDIVSCKNFGIVQPIISCGVEKDWEVLERQRTTPISHRFTHIALLKREGMQVAVNGEPFIPGWHTVEQFEDMLKRLKSEGINRYNIYNFHFNDFVAKRLLDIGLDIMAIWEGNQDENWKPIQQKLIDLAKKYDIILGCPDFVNTGSYFQKANTCCGVDVSNPMTFNTHTWKRILQQNPKMEVEEILSSTWDGIGDFEEGRKILTGDSKGFYTMKDIPEISLPKKKRGFLI